MEVVVATAGNPILMEFLKYMVKEVDRRTYRTGLYAKARCRCIYQTTGPSSMTRFLKHPSREAVQHQLFFFELNRPEIAEDWAKRSYDAITHFSMSYDTKELKSLVNVSTTHVELLAREPLRRKRFYCKCAAHVFPEGMWVDEVAPSPLIPIVDTCYTFNRPVELAMWQLGLEKT